jgi:hypothetical protein
MPTSCRRKQQALTDPWMFPEFTIRRVLRQGTSTRPCSS